MEEKDKTLSELLSEKIGEKDFKTLRELLHETNPVDVAEALAELPERELTICFRMLDKDTASEVFSGMEPDAQELLIRSLSDKELKEIVDDMWTDDAADLVEEMPANVVSRILAAASPETRKSINELLRYPEDSVGSIMTPVIDLSMWDQYQENRWKGRSTSNCYIVAGPGTYRIPLIYGNAWTNGSKNPNAYSTTNSGSNLLSTFLNYKDVALQSVFIKEDVGRSNVKDAVLIWEEGDGTSRTNTGGNGSNEGTVVKVISTIDNAVTGEDAYNTDNTTAGTLTNCDYLQFEVDYEHFNYGNAVVGIRDNSDKIIWSWHIWMVDPDWFLKNNATIDVDGGGHPATYASTNIGWVDGNVSVPAKTRSGKARLVQAESDNKITIDATQEKRRAFTTYFTNVLYQWGRKDPMRGNVNTTDMQSDNGAPRGVAGVKAWSNGYSVTNGTRTVGAMIQEPNTIYGSESVRKPSTKKRSTE